MHELKAAVSTASPSEPLAWREDRVVQRVLSAVPDEPVRAALERLVAELSKQHGALYKLLESMDRNRDGSLSREELRAGLQSLGLSLQPSSLDAVRNAAVRSRRPGAVAKAARCFQQQRLRAIAGDACVRQGGERARRLRGVLHDGH